MNQVSGTGIQDNWFCNGLTALFNHSPTNKKLHPKKNSGGAF
ncbi:hypothetical protein [Listeria newyorkensis]|nr:hypothetical protein [Listeria newyorkensis]